MEYVFKLFEFNIYNDVSIDSDSEECVEIKDNSSFVIQMFGINKEGQTASIIIEDYQPFFYLKVSNDWNESQKIELFKQLKKQVGMYYEKSIIECQLVEKKKLYGFDAGKKHKFIKLTFSNVIFYNKIKNLFYQN